MKILIIEDDNSIRQLAKTLLIDEKYDVLEANDGETGLIISEKEDPDLIILDIILPKMNGYEICNIIRRKPEKYGVPLILMLTSKTDIYDVVNGFESGADDYLKKPFDNLELILRVKALLKRKSNIFSKVYKYEGLIFDTERNFVEYNKEEIKLTKKEYEVLLYFLINKGILITREKIMDEIWDLPYFKNNKSVDKCIKKLKDKLDIFERNIKSVRGYGYILNNDPK